MATYGYQCDLDGLFDMKWPIGTAPELASCPACGEPAARVFTVPLLGLADRGRMSLLDHVEASRTEPGVVSSLPSSWRPGGRPGAAPGPDPRTSRLPRP
jgi:hypothetical protein